MKMYYAIEIIGYGPKQRYSIKDVWKDGTSVILHPVIGGKTFRTEEAARKAAEERGIEIELVGDFYQIIR